MLRVVVLLAALWSISGHAGHHPIRVRAQARVGLELRAARMSVTADDEWDVVQTTLCERLFIPMGETCSKRLLIDGDGAEVPCPEQGRAIN
jgi:hypothetical protein